MNNIDNISENRYIRRILIDMEKQAFFGTVGSVFNSVKASVSPAFRSNAVKSFSNGTMSKGSIRTSTFKPPSLKPPKLENYAATSMNKTAITSGKMPGTNTPQSF